MHMPSKVTEQDKKWHISCGEMETDCEAWGFICFVVTSISDTTCLAVTGSQARASHLKWRTQALHSTACPFVLPTG